MSRTRGDGRIIIYYQSLLRPLPILLLAVSLLLFPLSLSCIMSSGERGRIRNRSHSYPTSLPISPIQSRFFRIFFRHFSSPVWEGETVGCHLQKGKAETVFLGFLPFSRFFGFALFGRAGLLFDSSRFGCRRAVRGLGMVVVVISHFEFFPDYCAAEVGRENNVSRLFLFILHIPVLASSA